MRPLQCLLLSLAVCCATACDQNGQSIPKLSIRDLYPTHASPGPLVLGDVDGDSHVDAVVGLTGDLARGVDVLFGNGTGSLSAPMQVMGTTRPVTSVQLIDVDGDSKLDIVAAEEDVTFRNMGNRTFSAPVPRAVDATLMDLRPTQIVPFKSSADTAVVAAQLYRASPVLRDRLVTLRGSSNGTLSTGTTLFEFPMDYTVDGIFSGDFDGDGIMDIAAVANTNGVVRSGRIYTFFGANLSAPPTTVDNNFRYFYPGLGTMAKVVPAGGTSRASLFPTMVVVSTRDGDDWLVAMVDLVAQRDLTLARRIRAPYEVIGLAPGQFNRDTRPDLSLAVIDGNVQLLTRTTSANPDYRIDNFAMSFGATSLSAFGSADLNEDTFDDLIFVNKTSGQVEVRLNATTPAGTDGGVIDVPSPTDSGSQNDAASNDVMSSDAPSGDALLVDVPLLDVVPSDAGSQDASSMDAAD